MINEAGDRWTGIERSRRAALAPPGAVVPNQGTGCARVESCCAAADGLQLGVQQLLRCRAVVTAPQPVSLSLALPEVRSEGFPCAGSGGKVAGLMCTSR